MPTKCGDLLTSSINILEMSIFADRKRSEKLTADIDMRMYELVLDVLSLPEMDQSDILAYMRASYGKGYADALMDRGSLVKEHYL